MTSKAAVGLRTNAFAALVMFLAEFCLGTRLYGVVPASDHGRGLLASFGAESDTAGLMMQLATAVALLGCGLLLFQLPRPALRPPAPDRGRSTRQPTDQSA